MSVGPTVADATRAIAAAERRKLPVPDTIRQADAVRSAVASTVHKPAPERPALPATAAEVEQAIRDHALELQAHDLTGRAASRFQDEADHRFATAVAEAVPDWIAGLQKEFDTLVGVVRKAAAKLPDDISHVSAERMNWNNPVHTVAYTKAEGAVAQLEQLVADRADIVKVAGGDGGRDNALFSVASLPAPTVERVMSRDWQQLHPALATWRDLRQQPVSRWVYLVRQEEMTLSLATPGQVRERAGTVQLWRDATHARAAADSLRNAQAHVKQVLSA